MDVVALTGPVVFGHGAAVFGLRTLGPGLIRVGGPSGERDVRLAEGASALRLSPSLPPEPLVLRLVRPLDVGPGQQPLDAWLAFPVALALEALTTGRPQAIETVVPRALSFRLAYGPPDEAQLARSVDAELHLGELPDECPFGQALFPLRFFPPRSGPLVVERVFVPVDALGLYARGGRLVASRAQVIQRGPETAEIDVEHAPPEPGLVHRFGPPPGTRRTQFLAGLIQRVSRRLGGP